MRHSYISFVALGLLSKSFAQSASSGSSATASAGTNSSTAAATSASSASGSSATGTASQCSSQFSAMPSCATDPLTLAAITLGCDESDYACWCENADAVNSAAESEVSAACGDEISEVASATEALCKCASSSCGGTSVSPSPGSSNSTSPTPSGGPSNSSSSTSAAGGGNSSTTASSASSSSGAVGSSTGGSASATPSPLSSTSESLPSASSSSSDASPPLATAVGAGAACSNWVANIPACGVQPITQAVQAFGCGPDDYICWCGHVTDLQASWGPSIVSSCGLGSPGAVSAVNDLCSCAFLYAVSGVAPPSGSSKRSTNGRHDSRLRVFGNSLQVRQTNSSSNGSECSASGSGRPLITYTPTASSGGAASTSGSGSGSSSDGTPSRHTTTSTTLLIGLLAMALASHILL